MGSQKSYVEKRMRGIITKDNNNTDWHRIEDKLTNGHIEKINGCNNAEEVIKLGDININTFIKEDKNINLMNGNIKKDINGNFKIDKDNLSKDEDESNLHGYNKISPGCGKKIQLEDPTKKELLVRVFGFGGGFRCWDRNL